MFILTTNVNEKSTLDHPYSQHSQQKKMEIISCLKKHLQPTKILENKINWNWTTYEVSPYPFKVQHEAYKIFLYYTVTVDAVGSLNSSKLYVLHNKWITIGWENGTKWYSSSFTFSTRQTTNYWLLPALVAMLSAKSAHPIFHCYECILKEK